MEKDQCFTEESIDSATDVFVDSDYNIVTEKLKLSKVFAQKAQTLLKPGQLHREKFFSKF